MSMGGDRTPQELQAMVQSRDALVAGQKKEIERLKQQMATLQKDQQPEWAKKYTPEYIKNWVYTKKQFPRLPSSEYNQTYLEQTDHLDWWDHIPIDKTGTYQLIPNVTPNDSYTGGVVNGKFHGIGWLQVTRQPHQGFNPRFLPGVYEGIFIDGKFVKGALEYRGSDWVMVYSAYKDPTKDPKAAADSEPKTEPWHAKYTPEYIKKWEYNDIEVADVCNKDEPGV